MGGSKPWPKVPVGNKNHTNAAVVIIGAGISGMSWSSKNAVLKLWY